MVYLGQSADSNIDLSSISGNIDELVKRLEKIADELYTPDDFGIEPYKLYIKNRRYDLSVESDRNRVHEIIRQRNPRLLDIKYAELENIHQQFCNQTLCENLEKYIDIITSFSWMHTIRGDLSEYDTLNFTEKLTDVKVSIDEWKAKIVLSRLFSKGKVTQEIKEVLNAYFTVTSKEMIN